MQYTSIRALWWLGPCPRPLVAAVGCSTSLPHPRKQNKTIRERHLQQEQRLWKTCRYGMAAMCANINLMLYRGTEQACVSCRAYSRLKVLYPSIENQSALFLFLFQRPVNAPLTLHVRRFSFAQLLFALRWMKFKKNNQKCFISLIYSPITCPLSVNLCVATPATTGPLSVLGKRGRFGS